MPKSRIIAVNENTQTIVISLNYGCLRVEDGATLKISEAGCDEYETVCIPGDVCKPPKIVKKLIEKATINFPLKGKDSSGRFVFSIPQSFKILTGRYYQGWMEACGRRIPVHIQKTGFMKITETKTFMQNGWDKFGDCNSPLGYLPTITKGCASIGKGWMVVSDCTNPDNVMIAPLHPIGPYTIPQNIAGCDTCETFYVAPLTTGHECLTVI